MNRTIKTIAIGTLSISLLAQTMVSPIRAVTKDTTEKEESVYAILNSDGSVDKTIVSNWLHNDNGITNIIEQLNLTDVENVKTTEQPKVDGNTYTWNVDGDDLYYQGYSTKELPIDVKVTYYLDGKKVSSKDIAGKSGKVEIHIQLNNNVTETRTVNGKKVNVHPLYIAAGGLTLDNDIFSDVKCNTGKVVSEGNTQALSFVTIPGISDTLETAGLNDKLEDLSITDEIIIEANAKNFELGSIYFGAASNFDVSKISDINSLEELIDGVDQLQDAATQLTEGTSKLDEGGKTFYSNMVTLDDGVSELSDGVSNLTTLVNGVSKIAQGSSKISDGLQQLDTAASQGLTDVVKDSGTIDQMIASLEQLKTGETSLYNGISTLYSSLHPQDNPDYFKNSVLQIGTGIQSLSNLTTVGLSQEEVMALVMEGKLTQEQATSLLTNDGYISQGYISTIQAGYTQLQSALIGADGNGGLLAGIDQIYAGSQALHQGVSSIDTSGLTTMKNSLSTMLDSIALLDSSMEELDSGIQTLNTSASELTKLVEGVNKIKDGTSKLTDASKTLSEKIGELDSGMDKFKKTGIDQLASSLSDSDIELLLAIKDEMIKLNENEKPYSGVTENSTVTTKYIFKTNEIKVEE